MICFKCTAGMTILQLSLMVLSLIFCTSDIKVSTHFYSYNNVTHILHKFRSVPYALLSLLAVIVPRVTALSSLLQVHHDISATTPSVSLGLIQRI